MQYHVYLLLLQLGIITLSPVSTAVARYYYFITCTYCCCKILLHYYVYLSYCCKVLSNYYVYLLQQGIIAVLRIHTAAATRYYCSITRTYCCSCKVLLQRYATVCSFSAKCPNNIYTQDGARSRTSVLFRLRRVFVIIANSTL